MDVRTGFRWIVVRVVLCLLVGTLGLPSAEAEDAGARAEVSEEVWRRALEALDGLEVNVLEPDRSDPGAWQAFLADGYPRIEGVRGYASEDPQLEMPVYEIKGVGRWVVGKPRDYTMERTGSTPWGRGSTVTLSIHYRDGEPQLPQAELEDGRSRKVEVRVDFQPRTRFTAQKSEKSIDLVSSVVKGERTEVRRRTERAYAGQPGVAQFFGARGLLEGKPKAFINGGTVVYDSAGHGERLSRVILTAKHPAPGGWAYLQLDATVPIHADPAFAWQEGELHTLMERFVQAFADAAGNRSGAGAVRLLDANPLFTEGRPVGELDSPEELARRVTVERNAVAADGSTQVVLEVGMKEPGVLRLSVPEDGDLDPGTVSMLFGGRSTSVGSGDDRREVAYALYTAPVSFAEPRRRIEGHVLPPKERRSGTRTVELRVATGPSVAKLTPSPKPIEVPLTRPPVILVHGTFDEPNECWESDARDLEPAAGRISMAQALREVGCTVLKLDFSQTNGDVRSPDDSTFEHNARVLWENPGGLFEALTMYRDELGIAVTRADVVGHSLGGLIARLWASDAYNRPGSGSVVFEREATSGYRRPDNFQTGDIHRLVTIGTPHMGSDLGHLGIALREAPRDRVLALQTWFAVPAGQTVAQAGRGLRTALEIIGFLGLGAKEGYGISPVVRDQQPLLETLPNPKLTRIGATRVPSHAVVCAARIPDVSTFGGMYRGGLKVAAWWMLNARPETVKAFFTARGQAEDLDRIFGELIDLDQREREDGEAAGYWLFDTEHRIAPQDNYTLYAIGRSILFGNTQNDMVVRVESQAGGLPLQYTTFVRGVLHSYAARYARVQRAVVEALTGAEARFSQDGFPAPAPMRNIERFEVEQDPGRRVEAVEASNIVPKHAESLSYVADQQDIIIIMRPVNRYAEALIATNNATKDMHVKGKSANWGPQRGYIPVEQRFSKLHLVDPSKRAAQIRKFDAKVRDCLATNRALEGALEVSAGGETYAVLVVSGDDLEPPRAIVLRAEDGTLKGWQRGDSLVFDPAVELPAPPLPAAEIEKRGTRPLQVLADRHSRLLLTADYDILAFGPRFEPGDVANDPEMGFVTDWQRELIRKMNNEVRLRANYVGGNVSHHGPETQFVFSEGADYPNTVFEPDGDIWIIRKGPSGMQDLHLKRYFHVMREQGWHLGPNPHTWNWGPYDPERWPSTGWRPEDQLRITEKVLDEDNPFDSDEGDEPVGVGAANGGR